MNFVTIKGQKLMLKKSFVGEKEAFTAILTDPLEEILPPCEDLKNMNTGILGSYLIAEVLSVRDISKRLTDQLPSGIHSYLCQLSDGSSTVQAFEYTHWDFSLSVGSRVLLIPPIQVFRGLLLINPANILLLTS